MQKKRTALVLQTGCDSNLNHQDFVLSVFL